MSLSTIDFSAQFGGRDAAADVLPHFKALKAAARESRLEGFPFAELAFILRVDGDVNCYGISGAGNLEIDKDGEYLSVDIGINRADRNRIPDVISAAIMSSVEQIKTAERTSSLDVDFHAVQRCLNDLIARYRNEIGTRNGDCAKKLGGGGRLT